MFLFFLEYVDLTLIVCQNGMATNSINFVPNFMNYQVLARSHCGNVIFITMQISLVFNVIILKYLFVISLDKIQFDTYPFIPISREPNQGVTAKQPHHIPGKESEMLLEHAIRDHCLQCREPAVQFLMLFVVFVDMVRLQKEFRSDEVNLLWRPAINGFIALNLVQRCHNEAMVMETHVQSDHISIYATNKK